MRSATAAVSRSELACGREDVARALASVVTSVEGGGPAARHAASVATFAADMARRLDVPADERRTVELGALLHDVGKLCVPRSILAKRGPLTPKEWRIMRAHAEAGERILAPLLSLADGVAAIDRPDVLTIVRSHHERWDGSGYPDGLAGARIGLGARIVAVADAFQAMIEPRPYRRARRWSDALDELTAHCGSQFDPACVDAMLATAGERSRFRALVTPLASRRGTLAARVAHILAG